MRPSAPFLRSALGSPKSRVLLYNELNPLIRFPPDALSLDTSQDGIASLASVPFSSVIAHLPSPSSSPEDIVGDEGTLWPSQLTKRADADAPLDAFPTLVFLGADERDVDDRQFRATKDASASDLDQHTKGSPIWALDVSSIPALADISQVSAMLSKPVADGEELDFADMRAGMMSLQSTEASIAGTGRALLDWHRRNRYCPGCGRPTHSVWGGWKRRCTEDAEPHADEGRRKGGRPPCISRKGVHNFRCVPA